jgi:hypothetical protein
VSCGPNDGYLVRQNIPPILDQLRLERFFLLPAGDARARRVRTC